MAMLMLSAVPTEEAASFYRDFLAAFPDGRVGIHLQAQAVELEELCAGLTESDAMFRYAEGKWTIKEVIGHLLDTERVFAYRLLRISRGDVTELPGFDETTYTSEGQFNQRSAEELLSEFKLQRASTLALVNGIPPAAWPRIGTANGFRTSARALVYIILGHTAHHYRVLRERYRLRPTSEISRAIADKLFDVCNWTHETWILHRTLFDDNPDLQELGKGHHVYFLNRLNHILQEYTLLQMAKLHDPAKMSGRVNLSLAYIVDHGRWEVATVGRLRALKNRLDELDRQIRPARNRMLSHNDLRTLLDDQSLGGFPKDDDVEYFRTLHEFVSCVFEQVTGTVCAKFATFTRTDARGVIRALLERSRRRHSR